MIWPKKLYLVLFYIFTRTTPRFWQVFQNRCVSYFFFILWNRHRNIIQKNMSVILKCSHDDPAVRQAARRVFENYGLYLVDYVQMNRARKYLLPEEQGIQHVQQALDNGRGAILITPHLGNWELGAFMFAMRGCPIHALSMKDSETEVQDFRDRMRSTLAVRTVHIDPDNYTTVLRLVNLLKQNQVIAMLGDRWEGGKKVEVTFFGKKVYFPAGAPALALAAQAPIIPVFTVARPGGRYLAWAEKPIEVRRIPGKNTSELIAEKTQEIALAFESSIARYPDQWYHFFDYWERYGC